MNILTKLQKYLSDGNVIVTVLITVISTFSYDLVSSLINDIIFPLIDSSESSENVNGTLNDYIININGKKIKTGLFIRNLIKFILLFIIIMIFIGIIKN